MVEKFKSRIFFYFRAIHIHSYISSKIFPKVLKGAEKKCLKQIFSKGITKKAGI
jgi:hypothetical protein